jgi:hypothetical protein
MGARPNIYDRNLNKTRSSEVSASAFAFLFSEMVQYTQKRVHGIADLERRWGLSAPMFQFLWLILFGSQTQHVRLPRRHEGPRDDGVAGRVDVESTKAGDQVLACAYDHPHTSMESSVWEAGGCVGEECGESGRMCVFEATFQSK